jgi:hypothetical protein
MNKDVSNPSLNQTSNINNTECSITNKRINELNQLQSEYEYWQNKELEKNLQLMNDTISFSKKKDELKNTLDNNINENTEIKLRIKELDNSALNNKKSILEINMNLNELNTNIPLIENDNIQTYNDVKIYINLVY